MANRYKAGDLVMCIDTGGYDESLTKGKTYTVVSPEGNDMINVITNRGNTFGYYNRRFAPSDEVMPSPSIIARFNGERYDHYGPFRSAKAAEEAAAKRFGEKDWMVVELKEWEASNGT